MDIAGVSMALANAKLSSDVSIAVLDNAMEANAAAGAGMVDMIDAAAMERSVNPHLGAVFDMRV